MPKWFISFQSLFFECQIDMHEIKDNIYFQMAQGGVYAKHDSIPKVYEWMTLASFVSSKFKVTYYSTKSIQGPAKHSSS